MSDIGDPAQDAQRSEWEEFERRELAVGRCPGSGLPLRRRAYYDGPLNPQGSVMACGVCDCFGYEPEEVGPQSGNPEFAAPSPTENGEKR